MEVKDTLLKKINIALVVIIIVGNFLFNALDAGLSWVIFNFASFPIFIVFSTAFFLKSEKSKRKNFIKNLLKLGIIAAALVGEFWLFVYSIIAYGSTPEYNGWLTSVLYIANPIVLFIGIPYLVIKLFRFTDKIFKKESNPKINKKLLKFGGVVLLLILLYILICVKASQTWKPWQLFLW